GGLPLAVRQNKNDRGTSPIEEREFPRDLTKTTYVRRNSQVAGNLAGNQNKPVPSPKELLQWPANLPSATGPPEPPGPTSKARPTKAPTAVRSRDASTSWPQARTTPLPAPPTSPPWLPTATFSPSTTPGPPRTATPVGLCANCTSATSPNPLSPTPSASGS